MTFPRRHRARRKRMERLAVLITALVLASVFVLAGCASYHSAPARAGTPRSRIPGQAYR